jgi:hypothetical protein
MRMHNRPFLWLVGLRVSPLALLVQSDPFLFPDLSPLAPHVCPQMGTARTVLALLAIASLSWLLRTRQARTDKQQTRQGWVMLVGACLLLGLAIAPLHLVESVFSSEIANNLRASDWFGAAHFCTLPY